MYYTRTYSLFLLLIALVAPISMAEETPTKQPLPEITLPVPADAGQRQYLGLEAGPETSFQIDQIDADILVIELFSMYCPYCQQEAPLVNELHELMESRSTTDLKIKLIGLGAGNSAFEVDHFKKTYTVKFPLFPDQDLSMYNALAGKGTPGFIGCAKSDGKRFTIVLRQSGGFDTAEQFLTLLINQSTLPK